MRLRDGRTTSVPGFKAKNYESAGEANRAHPPVPLERIVAMINFDMVGRLRNDKLIMYGTSTATELKGIVDSVNAAAGNAMLRISGGGDGYGPSDQSSFYAKDIPVLHFFTDLHEDYHRATDDADKINAAGEARVVDLALRVARALADRQARLTFVRAASDWSSPSRWAGAAANAFSTEHWRLNDPKCIRSRGARFEAGKRHGC